MTVPPDSSRTYTDREVRVILKSAVELQQRRDYGAESSGGMSLAQLEQVAIEAGLDPELIRRAAAQRDTTPAPSNHNAFLGGPTQIVLERVVETSIQPAAFDQLLDVARSMTREVGEISTVGRQFGWKGRLDDAKAEVSVSADDRRTTLRVRVELDEVALEDFMLKGALAGVGGGLGASALTVMTTGVGLLGVAVVSVVVGTCYVWARRGFRQATIQYTGRARDLIDALAARTQAVAAADVRLGSESQPVAMPNG
jgi:hypothetical protein